MQLTLGKQMTQHKQLFVISVLGTLFLLGAFDFSNSLSGYGGGNSFGGLNGHYSFSPTYRASNGLTSFTPSFSRVGQVSSFNTRTGINTYGAEVSHRLNPSTSVFAGGSISSNRDKDAMVGVSIDF